MSQSFLSAAREQLEQLKTKHQLRTLRKNTLPTEFIDLSHNDYLGLRFDSEFQTRARDAIGSLPVGAGASRLLGGEHPVFEELESEFARWKKSESALYFSSGFVANAALIGALTTLGAEFYSDSLNHASIVDGMLAARSPKTIYPHSNLDFLEDALRRSSKPLKVIYTESLFSMDGDRARLVDLSMLAHDHDALLVVDDAHAVGCLGSHGAGLSPIEAVSINTCGKAIGVGGAVICGPQWVRQLLINKGRAFIYSTGASPWTAAAVREAIRFIEPLESRRLHLADLGLKLRNQLQKLGYETGASTSHIVPVIIGRESDTLNVAQRLFEKKILAPAVRPPTVAEGTCRLRLSLHADLSADQLNTIAEAFKEI